MTTSAIIAENGQRVTINFDEPISSTEVETGNSMAGFVVTVSGVSGNANLVYVAGSGTSVWTADISWSDRPDYIYLGESATFTYFNGFPGAVELIRDNSGTEVVTVGPLSMTNLSTQVPDTTKPLLSEINITTNGRSFEFVFNEEMTQSAVGLANTVNIFGVSIGDANVESAVWTDGTTLKFTMTKMVFSSEDPSGITFSYSSNGIRDISGNTLDAFTNRSATNNNSWITYADSGTNIAPKKLYFWTDEDEFEPVNFYNFRRDYQFTTIKRIGFIREDDWYPTNTTSAAAIGWTTGESTEIPLNFISSFLSSKSQWTTGVSDNFIDLGVLRNTLRGNVRDINRPFYDTFWLDPEPGSAWWSYSDVRYTQSEKDLVWDAMNDLNTVYIEELGIDTPICWYSTFPSISGRIGSGSGFDYGGGSPALAWGIKNNDPSDIDDTALFGEQSFYTSGLSWGQIDINNASNATRVYDRFGKNVRGHMIVGYPSALMIPAGSDYLKPPYTTIEAGSSSGGINLWKAYIDEHLELVPENTNRPVIVLLRTKFESHAVLAGVSGGYTSFEAPFTEDYWKEMIRYLRDQPKVDGVGIFARGIGMNTNTGNGVTPLDLYTWTAEILNTYNEAFVGSASTSQTIRVAPSPLMSHVPIFSLPSIQTRFDSRKLTLIRGESEVVPNPYLLDYRDEERLIFPSTFTWNFKVFNDEDRAATITDIEATGFISTAAFSPLIVGVRVPQIQTLPFSIITRNIPYGLNTLSGNVTFKAQFDGETSESSYSITVIYNSLRRDSAVISLRAENGRIAPNTYIDEFNVGLNRDRNADRNRNPGFNN